MANGDPVWKRYQKIFGEFYNLPGNVDVAHGKGLLSGRPPNASHCTNIGRFHRKMIHPTFNRWFDIDVSPEDEYSNRRDSDDLACWTKQARTELQPTGVVELVSAHGRKRATAARQKLEKLNADDRREHLRRQWSELLGDIQLKSQPTVKLTSGEAAPGKPQIERIVLEVESDVVVPLLLISNGKQTKAPVIVGPGTGRQGRIPEESRRRRGWNLLSRERSCVSPTCAEPARQRQEHRAGGAAAMAAVRSTC